MPITFGHDPFGGMLGVAAGGLQGQVDQFEANRRFQQPFQLQQQQFQQQQEQQQRQQSFQMDYQKQAFELQQQLSQAQLTQAEQIRMSRLQRQMDYIDANSGENGIFTPEMANDMRAQIQTGLSPLNHRQQQSQMLTQELQRTHVGLQNDQLQSTNAENERFRARGLQDRVTRIRHPITNEEVHMFERRPGEFEPIPFQNARDAALERGMFNGLTQREIVEGVREQIVQHAAQMGVPPDAARQPGWVEHYFGPQYQEGIRNALRDNYTPSGRGAFPAQAAHIHASREVNAELESYNRRHAEWERRVPQRPQDEPTLPEWLRMGYSAGPQQRQTIIDREIARRVQIARLNHFSGGQGGGFGGGAGMGSEGGGMGAYGSGESPSGTGPGTSPIPLSADQQQVAANQVLDRLMAAPVAGARPVGAPPPPSSGSTNTPAQRELRIRYLMERHGASSFLRTIGIASPMTREQAEAAVDRLSAQELQNIDRGIPASWRQ